VTFLRGAPDLQLCALHGGSRRYTMSWKHSARASRLNFTGRHDPHQDGSKKIILITGASGSVGKTFAGGVPEGSPKVRAMFRSEEGPRRRLECEVVLAGLSDKPESAHALRE